MRLLLIALIVGLAAPALASKPPRPLAELARLARANPKDSSVHWEIGRHGDKAAAELLLSLPAMKSNPRAILQALARIKDPEAASVIEPLLQHADNSVRSVAARQLGKLANPSSGPLLLARWGQETDRWTKGALLGALGPCASNEAQLRPLLDALDQPNLPRSVEMGVANMQDARLAPLLFPYLKSSSVRVRRLVAKTLGELGAPESEVVLLDAMERDEDPQVRQMAMQSLSAVGTPAALPRIQRYLQRPGARVPLELLKTYLAIDRRQGHAAMKPLYKKNDKASRALRRSLLNATWHDCHPSDEAVMLLALASKDKYERMEAVDAMANVGTAAAQQALCRILHQSRADGVLQGKAAQALGHYKSDEAIACLVDGFAKVKVRNDPDATAQREIARALRQRTGQNYQYDVKAWKAWQKAGFKSDAEAVEALSHTDASTRALAARRVLKNKDKTAAVDALLEALPGERSAEARIALVESLHKLGDRRCIEPFVTALETARDRHELYALVYALDELGDGRGTLHLVEQVAMEDSSKRQEAADMLARISGQPAHLNSNRWRQWWRQHGERYHK